MFQSTPVIANGRIMLTIGASPAFLAHGFNPRPLLLTGESFRRLADQAV